MTLATRLSAAAAAIVVVTAACPAKIAEAQAPPPIPSASASAGGSGAPAPPPEVHVEVLPVINTGGTKPILPWGWAEIVVRVQNTGSKPAKGVIKVESNQGGSSHDFIATAPYSVGAGASATVRVPSQVLPYTDLSVDVVDDAYGQLTSIRYSSTSTNSVVLFDISEPSRLRGAISEAYVAPDFVLPGSSSHPSGTGMSLLVATPRIDPTTGDAVLPDRAALYSGADAVLLRSETLSRLTGPDLEALAGYVLAGGTLAVTITRPEDMRHPTLVSLVGGEITKSSVDAETKRALVLPKPYGPPGSGKVIPSVADPSPAVAEALTGFRGGNLRPTIFGSTATYGLGEVHVLAFDPTRAPAVDDDWVKGRVLDLTRRGYDRRSTLVFRSGDLSPSSNVTRVRQQLDPNESSRWAIAAATILLCAYAVLAGPVNFSLASKKGQPLRALRYLPLIAAITFGLIVAIGIAAKGVTGRARHLTLVEAGAGMTKGTARRWRGFFAASTEELTIRTTDSLSVVSTAALSDSPERREHLLVDRDGARLTEVTALPWQTLVIREDGFANIGEGISIVKEGASDVALINRSGRRMRGAILWLPSGDVRYWPRVEDGAKVVSTSGLDLPSTTDGRLWYSQVLSTRRVGAIDVHELYAHALRSTLEKDAPGLSEAWAALAEAPDSTVDWFPNGVPVLLCQLDGGEGRMSDSGLRLESDRLLARVVGFGGKP